MVIQFGQSSDGFRYRRRLDKDDRAKNVASSPFLLCLAMDEDSGGGRRWQAAIAYHKAVRDRPSRHPVIAVVWKVVGGFDGTT